MDAHFRILLEAAEHVRRQCKEDNEVGPHAAVMAELMVYGRQHNLLTGNILLGTASDEFFYQAAEGAACILEVICGDAIGSILTKSRTELEPLIWRAVEGIPRARR